VWFAIQVVLVSAGVVTSSHAADTNPPHPAAEIVFVNARVYTMNPKRAWAEAIAVRGDEVLAVGSAKDVSAYRGSKTRVIDAGGRLVLPGLTDCHTHFLDGALSLDRVHLDDAKDVPEILRRVKRFRRSSLRTRMEIWLP